MLKAAKTLIAVSYAALLFLASTFAPQIWHATVDIGRVRMIAFFVFVLAAITARILLTIAIHRDKVEHGIVAPFPYTTYPGIDPQTGVSTHRKTG
jgi:hypothetical protein